MKNIIEVKNFTKKFGDFTAVDNVSFNVEAGTIFGFLGPNGAGKSTTINTLCTIIDKSGGELKINGFDVSKDRDKVREQIGIVFQDSTLDEKLTVEENIKLHCRFYNVSKNEVNERIDFVLDVVDLKDWKKEQVNGLSGGMKRRVEIARGLVHYPKVLFLDEPTTGLDPQTRANIWEYIYKLQQQKNITIFLTTHYMEEAEVCSKVAVMEHGKIAAFDTPDNLKKQYTETVTKITTKDNYSLKLYLEERHIKYNLLNNIFTIYSSKINTVLEIVSTFNKYIVDFETKNGTLNDVFLNLTKKESSL